MKEREKNKQKKKDAKNKRSAYTKNKSQIPKIDDVVDDSFKPTT